MATMIAFGIIGLVTLTFTVLTLREDMMKKPGH